VPVVAPPERTTTQASFAAELYRLRQQAGLSHEELAERAEVAVNTVAALERGRRRHPHPRTLAALIQALRLDPTDRARLLELADSAGQSTQPPATPAQPRGDLPKPATPLIGRADAVARAAALLAPSSASSRLLTLIGPGGVGKTRLALAVASTLTDAYADGVVFVDLSTLHDAQLVPASIARALGVRESGSRSAQELVLEFLRDRQLLLVLDNFEHLLSVAPLLAELLQGASRLTLLVTSRTALRLRAERRLAVPPLATPASKARARDVIASAPAVALFVERSRAADPEFALTSANATAVALLCRRLDGLPLALELAAAWVPLLPPAVLLRRLEQRLPLPSVAALDAPARQQTLRATLAWSYDLLGAAERTLLRRLAVFAGGWSLEAAEGVCADADLTSDEVLASLSTLIDSSLVRRISGDGEEARFGLLETVRDAAEERLMESGEADRLRRRHLDWYAAWAERARRALTGPDQATWYGRLSTELDNCRAARAWSKTDPTGADAELRLAAGLGRFFHFRMPGIEARDWLRQALARGPQTPSAARGIALTWLGQSEYLAGDAAAGRARLADAVIVAHQAGDSRLLALSLRHLALYVGDPEAEPVLLHEAAETARAVGDSRELALALSYLGAIYEHQGELTRAANLYQEAVAAARDASDVVATADGLLRLGQLRLAGGESAAAAAAMHEALGQSRAIGYDAYVALAERQLARVALATGDLVQARERVLRSLALAREAEPGTEALGPLRTAASVAVALGEPALAVRLLASETAWRERHPLGTDSSLWARWVLSGQGVEDDLERARAALGDAGFALAWAEGSSMTLKSALDQAVRLDAHGS
jgi:predicted ATPase/DNA-binding XRE family transcriptional regulator